MKVKQFVYIAILLPLVVFGQPIKKHAFLPDNDFFALGGISIGYSPMLDSKFDQWLNSNAHGKPNIYYGSFKATLAFARKKSLANGIDFDFYGTWATTNYPLRFNLGYLVGKNFAYKNVNIFFSGTIGFSKTKVNKFNSPIPSQLTANYLPIPVELKYTAFYISPSIKFLWCPRKNNNVLCGGLDLGMRIYMLNSNWTAGSINAKSGQTIPGVPNLTTFDFYANIFIGALQH